jgi:hypothetical protein
MTQRDKETQEVLDQLSLLAPGAQNKPQPAAHAFAQLKGQIEPAAGRSSRPRFSAPCWIRSLDKMFRRRTLAVGLSFVLLLAILFSFPAVRAGASEFLGLFRVQKFAPISISPGQIAILEQLAEEGMEPGELVIRNEPGAITVVDSLDEASLRTGLDVRTLSSLGEPDEINVLDGGDGYLIIDLAAARAIVEAAGADPALLPDSLDGARVDVAAFPGVQQLWGEDIIFMQAESPLVEYPDDIDPAVLGEALLQVLGTEPREARRIAQSIDWASTLLLPIPSEMVTFSEVVVDGVNGVALEPLDGEGSAMLWQKEGKVYMLNGQGPVEELLSIVASSE